MIMMRPSWIVTRTSKHCAAVVSSPNQCSSGRCCNRQFLSSILPGRCSVNFRHKSTELVDGPGIGATYRQNLSYRLAPKSYRQKREKPSTAKKLPSCRVTVPSKSVKNIVTEHLPGFFVSALHERVEVYMIPTAVIVTILQTGLWTRVQKKRGRSH